jgi:hypothetical protein
VQTIYGLPLKYAMALAITQACEVACGKRKVHAGHARDTQHLFPNLLGGCWRPTFRDPGLLWHVSTCAQIVACATMTHLGWLCVLSWNIAWVFRRMSRKRGHNAYGYYAPIRPLMYVQAKHMLMPIIRDAGFDAAVPQHRIPLCACAASAGCRETGA